MKGQQRPKSLGEVSRALFATTVGPGWELLRWIAEARYATTDLVALRFYPTRQGVRTATHRLAELRRWEIGGRPLLCSRLLRGSRQVYFLGEAGARLISDHLERPVREFWHEGVGVVADGIVQHYLAVTRFEVALRLYAMCCGGEVARWEREPVMETEAGELRPDAAFTYSQDGKTWHYALEIDRGTEAPAKFAAKLPKYGGLHKGPYRFHWDEVPDCLVVTPPGGVRRAQRLMEEVNSLPRARDEYRRFKYVAEDELYYIPPSQHGLLPEVTASFHLDVCMAVRGGEIVRRAVFG